MDYGTIGLCIECKVKGLVRTGIGMNGGRGNTEMGKGIETDKSEMGVGDGEGKKAD